MSFEAIYDSPIGPLRIHASGTHLLRIEFARQFAQDLPASEPSSLPMEQLWRELDAYFAGNLDRFDTPLAASGTPFQKRVWQALREIPCGATATYGDIARRLGQPTAARAVGLANNRNPLPIVVPCHRVVGANGSLTGFAGGLWRKRWLLDHEQKSRKPAARHAERMPSLAGASQGS